MIKYNENIKNYEEKLKNTDSEKLRQETTKLIEKEKIKIILMFSFQEQKTLISRIFPRKNLKKKKNKKLSYILCFLLHIMILKKLMIM